MPGKRKNPRKIAEGLAKGLTQVKACQEAGYAPSTAQKLGYRICKRPLVQSLFTDACERLMKQRGLEFDALIEPYFDGLKAKVIVKSTQLGDAQEVDLPDHPLRMDAADRIVNLFGGKPREVDMPADTAKGLVVIIAKDGVSAEKAAVDITPKATIEAQGEGQNPPVPVRIVQGGDA